MSTILEVEEEAAKETKKVNGKAKEPTPLEDEDDFDIEILDLDDLDL